MLVQLGSYQAFYTCACNAYADRSSNAAKLVKRCGKLVKRCGKLVKRCGKTVKQCRKLVHQWW